MKRRLFKFCFQIVALTFFLMVALPFSAHAQQEVTTKDGRRIWGKVSSKGKAILVRTGVRDIYLSPAIAKKGKKIAPDPIPVYEFPEQIKAVKEGKKKGKISLVTSHSKWVGGFEGNRAKLACKDPKLGDVTVELAITKFTPQIYYYEGINYVQSLSFTFSSLMQMNQFLKPLSRPKTFKSYFKIARFYRHARQMKDAKRYLDLAAKAEGADEEAVKLERFRLDTVKFDLLKKKIERADFGYKDALVQKLLLEAKFSEEQKKEHPEVFAYVSKLNQRQKKYEAVKKWMEEKKADTKTLTLRQAEQIHRLVKMGSDSPQNVDAKWIPVLGQAWMNVGRLELKEDILKEAQTLAKETADYFYKEDKDETEDLGDKYKASKLPLELKLAIFKYAVAYKKEEAIARWAKVEWKHPKEDKDFHYYISVPRNYDPNRSWPVIVVMHGQHSKAVRDYGWRRSGNANGFIVIGAEYIYGRKWGYKYTVEEHRAVLDSVWHAAKTHNIDLDRVFLTGQSQGGHSSWEMGAAHAGRLAGTAPFIGCLTRKRIHMNYKDGALYCVDGSEDGAAPKYNRMSIKLLSKMKCDATYVEYPGRFHEAFQEEYQSVMDWMIKHKRNPTRRSVNLLAYRFFEARRNWVQVDETFGPLSDSIYKTKVPAMITGTFKKNTFTLKTKNVKELTVFLNPAMIDFSKKIVIKVNGKNKEKVLPKIRWKFALNSSLLRRDRVEIFVDRIVVNP